jgi:hypothetical protein
VGNGSDRETSSIVTYQPTAAMGLVEAASERIAIEREPGHDFGAADFAPPFRQPDVLNTRRASCSATTASPCCVISFLHSSSARTPLPVRTASVTAASPRF